MAQAERVDMLVLGSGEAGKYLAWHMAHAGHRTAVVERQWIGGSCPNINCLPSKNEIWSAKVADLVHHAAAFGTVTGPGSVDMARVRQRKRDMVEGLIAMHLERYRARSHRPTMGFYFCMNCQSSAATSWRACANPLRRVSYKYNLPHVIHLCDLVSLATRLLTVSRSGRVQ